MSAKKFLNFTEFVNEKYSYKKDAIVEDAPVGGTTPASPAAPLTINFNKDFPSGKWKLDQNQTAGVMAELNKIEEYIKNNASSNFEITINSGESQVPNRDADAQKGPDGQFPRLQPGQLATNRANSVKAVLDQYIAGLKTKGVNTDSIKVTVAPPVIGQTPWQEGKDANDPAYVKEQFVTLTINATGSNPQVGTDEISRYAINGEVVRKTNGRVLGTIHYMTTKDGAGIDTSRQNAIIRLSDDNGMYTNKYVPINAGEIQKFFGTTSTLQNDKNFADYAGSKLKDVPQTDKLYGKNINDASNV